MDGHGRTRNFGMAPTCGTCIRPVVQVTRSHTKTLPLRVYLRRTSCGGRTRNGRPLCAGIRLAQRNSAPLLLSFRQFGIMMSRSARKLRCSAIRITSRPPIDYSPTSVRIDGNQQIGRRKVTQKPLWDGESMASPPCPAITARTSANPRPCPAVDRDASARANR